MTVPPPLVAAQIVEALIVPCIRTAQSISLSANSPPSTGGVAFLYDRPKPLNLRGTFVAINVIRHQPLISLQVLQKEPPPEGYSPQQKSLSLVLIPWEDTQCFHDETIDHIRDYIQANDCSVEVLPPDFLLPLSLQILKPNVGTIGISKGGDLALSLATYIPEVKAAVWINGCNANVQSTLHLHQGKLPGLEYDISKMQVVDGVFDTYEAVLNPEDYPETIIPIEMADANFLFLVGLADKNWKSELYADLAIKRLQKAGRDNYKVHKYEGTGHLIECPYSPYNHTVYSRLIRAPIVYGGAMVPHQQAQLQVWNILRKFLTRFIR
ncbi:hypothetical protein Pcinc_000047 [Petrolisthes cinctipes]|uniref:BAAT/Acyl-CoA thioester hydrolase C-terminal domain-containing protein n=1 Tax=Petrolisthes cinctipes TaxID=88211 RepID=A0AAE1L552_PETCI|nr:hypothetical protein Pcinc_000047 [Petrolisthes cinctipes]